jgi:hypothetical protein
LIDEDEDILEEEIVENVIGASVGSVIQENEWEQIVNNKHKRILKN